MFEIGDVLRWVYGRMLGRPMNFSFIDDHVSGSAKPMQKKEIEWLKQKGVAAILSVTEDPLLTGWVDGIPYLNVPMKNHSSPTPNQLKASVNFLISETSAGRKTNVHCAAGSGRTGTVLAAYLCRKYGLGAEEAIGRVRQKRRGSIERKQEGAVRNYAEGLKQNK
jgi:atypical dual specificity phosphatase